MKRLILMIAILIAVPMVAHANLVVNSEVHGYPPNQYLWNQAQSTSPDFRFNDVHYHFNLDINPADAQTFGFWSVTGVTKEGEGDYEVSLTYSPGTAMVNTLNINNYASYPGLTLRGVEFTLNGDVIGSQTNITAIPEPATIISSLLGLAGFALRRFRKV